MRRYTKQERYIIYIFYFLKLEKKNQKKNIFSEASQFSLMLVITQSYSLSKLSYNFSLNLCHNLITQCTEKILC